MSRSLFFILIFRVIHSTLYLLACPSKLEERSRVTRYFLKKEEIIMRYLNIRRSVPVCVALVCVLCAGEVMAQVESKSAKSRLPAGDAVAGRHSEEEIVTIRKLIGLGKQGKIKTPQYRTNVSGGTKPEREWVQITVTYDTAPDWIDELTFQYHVLALTTTKEGKKSYSLFRDTVRYVDIERGRGHESTMFLWPNAIKRFGELMAVAVEISHEGKVVAEKSDHPKNIPEGWWKRPEVVENEMVTIRNGYLLNRSQSPFAFINMDDYESIK